MKRSSVRPSVCLFHRSTIEAKQHAEGLLLSAPRARDVDRQQAPALSSKCVQCHADDAENRLVCIVLHTSVNVRCDKLPTKYCLLTGSSTDDGR